jgi:uncharacterized protein (TIGR02444 family)
LNLSLWTFSVSLYQQAGVEAECLSLQDRFGVNVNVLFLCLYAGAKFGAKLSRGDIEAAERLIVEWDTQVVKTLRKLRQLLKRNAERSEWPQSTELLRANIKDTELASERIESSMLQEWFEGRLPRCSLSARHEAVDNNLYGVFSHYGAGERTESSLRLADLVLSCQF